MSTEHFKPQTREELLAADVAEALGDRAGFPYYLTIARRYPESHIRAVLRQVTEVPAERIRTSRGALFNWLIHHYDADSNNHTGAAPDSRA